MKIDILKKTCDNIVVVCADIRCTEKARNIADKLQVDVIDLYPENADDMRDIIQNDDSCMYDKSEENIDNNNISCADYYQKNISKVKQKEGCAGTVNDSTPINNLKNRLYIKVSSVGVSLCKDGMEMYADLTHMVKRLKKNNLQGELIVKAAKFSDKCKTAFDATAGMAEDSLLLAGMGFHVTLYEKNPVIFILVKDALERAQRIPELAEAVSRMQLVNGDSIEAMLKLAKGAGCQAEKRVKIVSESSETVSKKRFVNGDSIEAMPGLGENVGCYTEKWAEMAPELSESISKKKLANDDSIGTTIKLREDTGCCADNVVIADRRNNDQNWGIEGDNARSPDIILLDPMFPERQKSGLVKKKFQLIHNLECPCNDEKEMLEAAMAAEPKKIIIKRPIKGPYLAGIRPSYSLTGKSIRYDCIINIK